MSEVAPRNEYQRFLTQLPEDWPRVPIRQIGTVVGGGTPSRDVAAYWRGAIPWLTPGEVSGNQSKKLGDTAEHISLAGLAGSGAKLLPPGSLMVTTRATLGARAINAVPMTTNQGFKSVIFHHAGDADYYYYLLERVRPELVRRASGTTFLEISGAEFGSILVPDPSPPEKQCIAQVFDTLDTAIRETEAIIAKLKAVKQGLLHDLLTRGIDANGELRPPQAEAPHLYKQSPLGWIPKEWLASSIGECAEMMVGPAFESHRFTSNADDLKLLRGINVSRGFVRWDEAITVRWPKSDQSVGRYLLEEGDIVIGMDGALVGRNVARITSDDLPALLVQRVARLRAQSAMSSWIYMNLQSSRFLARIDGLKTHTAIPHMAGGDILDFGLARPSGAEMSEIAEAWRHAEIRIEAECKQLAQLKGFKTGLMDDLLTGRVRVTPLLSSAQQAQTRSA